SDATTVSSTANETADSAAAITRRCIDPIIDLSQFCTFDTGMALEQFRLDGQVAIVTGAGRGVGAGIAKVLAEAGVAVVGTVRTPAEVTQTIKEIENAGGTGLALVADATDRADGERVVETTMDRFGRIDILVNNVGGST